MRNRLSKNRNRFVFAIFTALTIVSGPTAAKDAPRLPWLSAAPEVGYQFFGPSTLEQDFNTRVEPRHGVVVKGHVDLGGDRVALELAPLFARQLSSGLVGDLSAFGGEATLVYRFSRGRFYPGIGLGFHGTYLFPNDTVARGCELQARIPIGMTWYFFRFLGLVVESGFHVGTVGIRFKDGPDKLHALSEKTEYGLSLGFDLLIGLRFP